MRPDLVTRVLGKKNNDKKYWEIHPSKLKKTVFSLPRLLKEIRNDCAFYFLIDYVRNNLLQNQLISNAKVVKLIDFNKRHARYFEVIYDTLQ